jgi:transposase-like protein
MSQLGGSVLGQPVFFFVPMPCPYCHSEAVVKNGTRRLSDGQV